MPNHNIQRLSEDIKREVAAAVRDLKDSRISEQMVTVTHCEVTSDLSYCRIYVSCINGSKAAEKVIECLKNAQGFIKKRINARIKMRKIPELVFLPDNSLDYYEKISRMIDNLPENRNDMGNEDKNYEN